MKIKTRIWLVVLSTIISVCVLSSVVLYQSNNFMMFLLKDKIQALTESNVGIAERLNDRVLSGELTLDKAKQEYASIVHKMRYDNGKEFFFAVDYEGTFIAMGGDPKLVGVNIIDLKDFGTGRPMTRDLIALAKGGGGFYDHNWPKAGKEEPEPKVAYVIGYEPWKMYIGTGLYFDNINTLFKEFTTQLGIMVFVLIALLSGALFMVARGIFNRINWINDAMNDVASGDADLRVRLDEKIKDEFSDVAKSFNAFISEVQSIVASVRSVSEQVIMNSTQMADSVNETRATVKSQLQETELTSTAINEMSSTVHEIAQTASNTASSTNETAETAARGKKLAGQVVESMHQLGDDMQETHQRITELRNRSEDIGTILEVIKGVAEQTNLLALNAAIEAARAGEQGRGFAVVADEVRNLAQRTQQSTTEIEEIINHLQAASVTAHDAMTRSHEKMANTVQLSEASGESLEQIQQNTVTISDMNTQVATATEQQTIVVEDINQNVTSIFAHSQQVAQNAELIAESSETLKALAEKAEQELGKFTV